MVPCTLPYTPHITKSSILTPAQKHPQIPSLSPTSRSSSIPAVSTCCRSYASNRQFGTDQTDSLGSLLQWSFHSKTRRSLLTEFAKQVTSPIVQRWSPSPISHQPSQTVRPNTFPRRLGLLIPFFLTCYDDVAQAEEKGFPGSFLQSFGIGDRDIYYPRYFLKVCRIFEGSWICNSTLVAIDTPQGEDKADRKSIEFARKQMGYTVTYKARFIPFENHIIGDRLFTTMSLVESSVGKNVVDHGIWTPKQPDRLALVLRNGAKVQNVVTRRSASLSKPGQFDTFEYSQQIFDNTVFLDGPPTIKASQNITRYRWDATVGKVPYIEAYQRVYMFPVVQEGLSNLDIGNLDKPITVYKYILKFTRDES